MDEHRETASLTSKPNPFTTVTTLSKTLALLIFIALPFIGFWLGTKYQEQKDTITFTHEFERHSETKTISKTVPETTSTPAYLEAKEIPSDWKTYENKKYSYSLKYPAYVDLGTDIDENSQYVSFHKSDAIYISEQSLYIYVLDNPQNLKLEDWVKTPSVKNTFMLASESNLSSQSKVTLGDNIWNTYSTFLGLPPNINFNWVGTHQNKVILISNNSVDDATFRQILSSFKFIK
jgi:hypothetical protein